MSWFSGLKDAVAPPLRARCRGVADEGGDGIPSRDGNQPAGSRRSLSPDEARRRALVTFGGVTQHQETLRDGRGLAWLGGLSLDFKLGLRMLRKYPGLTLVGGLAMAFGFWVGAVTFEMVTLAVNPKLPLPGGDRIVQIRNWDAVTNWAEPRALHDFIAWRQSLSTVTDLGAWQDVTRNLVSADGEARGVAVAEITASAFTIAPTPAAAGSRAQGD